MKIKIIVDDLLAKIGETFEVEKDIVLNHILFYRITLDNGQWLYVSGLQCSIIEEKQCEETAMLNKTTCSSMEQRNRWWSFGWWSKGRMQKFKSVKIDLKIQIMINRCTLRGRGRHWDRRRR